MRIIYRTRQLERAYKRQQVAVRRWGPEVGNRYRERIDRIRTISTWPNLFEYRSLGLHPLRGPRQGQYAIRLTGRWRLIVRQGSDPDEIEIVDVEDYHD